MLQCYDGEHDIKKFYLGRVIQFIDSDKEYIGHINGFSRDKETNELLIVVQSDQMYDTAFVRYLISPKFVILGE